MGPAHALISCPRQKYVWISPASRTPAPDCIDHDPGGSRPPGRRAGSRSHGSIAPPSRSNESHGHGFPRGTRKWFGQKRTARHLTALKYKEGAARPHNFNGVPATSGANTQQEAVRSAPQRVPLGPPATAACRLGPETRRAVILDHKSGRDFPVDGRGRSSVFTR